MLTDLSCIEQVTIGLEHLHIAGESGYFIYFAIVFFGITKDIRIEERISNESDDHSTEFQRQRKRRE